MQVVTTDDNGTLHFQLLDNSIQDATTNANVSGEWTLFVDISSIDCLEQNSDQISSNITCGFQNLPLLVF